MYDQIKIKRTSPGRVIVWAGKGLRSRKIGVFKSISSAHEFVGNMVNPKKKRAEDQT